MNEEHDPCIASVLRFVVGTAMGLIIGLALLPLAGEASPAWLLLGGPMILCGVLALVFGEAMLGRVDWLQRW